MRDLKPLPSGSSAACEGHATAGGGSGGAAGGGSVYTRSTAFEPVRLMNVTRVERPTGRVSTTTTCNIEDGSDYEYVWTMSPPPPLLSSGRLLPKMRLRRLLPGALDGPAREDDAAARSPADQSRPDLVSRLDGAFEGGGGSPDRHRRRRRRRSEGFPGAGPSRCTCGLDGEAPGTIGDDADSPRIRVRFRKLSGDEEGEHLLDSSSSSLLLLHRTQDAGIVSPDGIELGPVAAGASGTRPGTDADDAGGLTAGGALRKVCRHCRHVVAADGSGSLRFAPGGAGTAAVMLQAPPCLMPFSKRLTEKNDGNVSKTGGLHAGTAVPQSQHNA